MALLEDLAYIVVREDAVEHSDTYTYKLVDTQLQYVDRDLLTAIRRNVSYDYPCFTFEKATSEKQNEDIEYFMELYEGAIDHLIEYRIFQIDVRRYPIDEQKGVLRGSGQLVRPILDGNDRVETNSSIVLMNECVRRSVILVRYSEIVAFKHYYGL